jgi:hypothetical protein
MIYQKAAITKEWTRISIMYCKRHLPKDTHTHTHTDTHTYTRLPILKLLSFGWLAIDLLEALNLLHMDELVAEGCQRVLGAYAQSCNFTYILDNIPKTYQVTQKTVYPPPSYFQKAYSPNPNGFNRECVGPPTHSSTCA